MTEWDRRKGGSSMELTMENTVEYTEYLIREYYKLNAVPMLSVLDPDVMWIGPGNLFVFGKAAVESYFKDGFVMPPMVLENLEFYSLPASETTRIVIGRYKAHSMPGAGQIIAGCQRITMHYTQWEKEGPVRLTHMHISNEWNELVDDEVFPVKISTQTYRYVQRMLKEGSRTKRHRKVVLCNRSSIQRIDPDMVVYLEAIGKSTILHFINKSVTVRGILGEMAKLFPKNFHRVHRGYLINCDYVDSMEKSSVTLITGAVIPIPEKRYAQVRQEIMDLLRTECQR